MRCIRFVSFLISLLSLSTFAHAQTVKPKILILFDTSGSMLWNSLSGEPFSSCFPGSSGCTIGGQCNCDAGLKCYYGSSANSFALCMPSADTEWRMDGSQLCSSVGQNRRLYQLKAALFESLQGMGADEIEFGLQTFPQVVNPAINATCPKGHYDQPPATISEYDSALPLNDPDIREGCKLTAHEPFQAAHQNGFCGTTNCPWYTSFKQEALRVAFGAQPEAVMRYFDQVETSNQVSLTNPEVRAFNFTPLGKSLFYAHGYFHKEAVLPANDYRKKCERLAIAMFTDGVETCQTDAVGNIVSGDAYDPANWATNLATLGVHVHVIAIDTNAGSLQTIAQNGDGSYVSVAGTTAELKKAFLDIVASSLPPAEICNNEDDDCDGAVDEDFPLKNQPCDNDLLGACFRTGKYVCNQDGSGVVCSVDKPAPKIEVCNGIDDDCDGAIDDGLPNCIGCVPQAEVCNGLDDDCDGKIDDGIPSQPCGSNLGECKAGKTSCVNGAQICSGGTGPTTEVCDNKDNDCDGIIDGITEPCYDFDTGCDLAKGTCAGTCRLGSRICTDGKQEQCVGALGPSTEICDGLDNNCDGQVDETHECPDGAQCIAGECSQSCISGEFVCPVGQLCINGWCLSDPCDRDACLSKGWVCKSGECIDPCEGKQCFNGETCVLGVCRDLSCYGETACPQGQRCIQGACATDPCNNVSCGSDEYCVDGVCIELCEPTQCAKGSRCVLTSSRTDDPPYKAECATDPCATVSCSINQVCVNGTCIENSCNCNNSQFCVEGRCEANPCEVTRCPAGTRCELGICFAAGLSSTDVLATGSGGFACRIANESSNGIYLVFYLLGLFFLRRRSRRTSN